MRLVTVSAQEAAFLAHEVKKKYETLSGEELVITSYLARYEGLTKLIKTQTTCFDDVDIVSNGLLRKLLESGKRKESTKINRQFIDACYLFITDCTFTRDQHHAQFPQSIEQDLVDSSSPAPRTIKKFNWPYRGKRVQFSLPKDVFLLTVLLAAALLIWALASNWQYILLQMPSPAPKYLWWVAEYPNGTKVYNNFRRYRTEKEVIDYFLGRGLEDGTRNGDCNAIYWSDNNRYNICYDTIDTIRKFEKEHGGKPEIRFDG